MLNRKIIVITIIALLSFSSVSAYDFWKLDNKLNTVNDRLDNAFKRVDTKMLKFEEKMDSFETQFRTFKCSCWFLTRNKPIKRFREIFISDPRGYNSTRWIKSRHY